MKTNKEFNEIISNYTSDIQELGIATRQLIYNILPKVVECPWIVQKTIGYGTGPKKMSEHFCWIAFAKKHVTLGFNYGAELPDPEGILEGTGKRFKHYKIKKAEDLKRKELIEMLRFSTRYKVPSIND